MRERLKVQPGPVLSLPGPIPTLIMSAPDSSNSSTISPVTTLPACGGRGREGEREGEGGRESE